MENTNTTAMEIIAKIKNPEFAFEFQSSFGTGKPKDAGIHFYSNFADALTMFSNHDYILTPAHFRGYVRDKENNTIYLYDFTQLMVRITEKVLRYCAGVLTSIGNDPELLEKSIVCFLAEHRELSIEEYAKVGPKSRHYESIIRKAGSMVIGTSNRRFHEKHENPEVKDPDELNSSITCLFEGDIPRLSYMVNRYFIAAYDSRIGTDYQLHPKSKQLLKEWIREEIKKEFTPK